MNVYRHEFRANFKSMITWIISLGSIVAMFMCFFPMLKADMDNFLKLMDNFPPVMKAMMGIVVANFATTLGYYSFIFTYSSLFAAIQAMNLGVGIVSKEEREKTADFLMTKPVSRVKILTAKLLSVLTVLVITNIIYTLISFAFVSGMADGDYDTKKFVLMNASLFFIQLVFFSIGLVISVTAKKIKSVLPISLGLVFGFFAISAFAVTAANDKLRYLTPFQYFKAEYILAEGHYENVYAFVGLFIVLAGIAASYLLYKRRDIHSV
jgi:ABC-2 type transport system permease protein